MHTHRFDYRRPACGEPATISDDGSGIVSGFYDLTILNISDGTDSAIAYISLSTDDESDGYGLEVPMAYYAPGWVLQYSFEPLESGTTIVVALEVADFGGNSASVNTLVDVP